MTDRELLENSAKAAGLINPRYVEATSWGTGISHGKGDDVYRVWNPLESDGDALRLAVKLGFEIDMDRRSIAIRHQTGVKILRAFNNDPYESTRRAIVMAAAQIGKEVRL